MTREETLFAPRSVLAWTLLSACAGTVNGGAVLAAQSVVAHVTGSITNLGVEGGRGGAVLEFGVVVAAFFFGAALATALVDALRPRLGTHAAIFPFMLVILALFVASMAGELGAFGPFGGEVDGPGPLRLIALLAASMGIQNATVAIVTANAIRTTHATGPMTDLATNVVRATFRTHGDPVREGRWALLRAVKLTSFVGGALLASRTAPSLGYNLFSLAAFLAVLATGFFEGGARTAKVTDEEGPAPAQEPPTVLERPSQGPWKDAA